MRTLRVLADLSVFRQGLSVGFEFGSRALAHLAAVAELIEKNVYEPGSLRLNEGVVEFVLLNPPLRMGAFSAIRVSIDAAKLPEVAIHFDPGEQGAWVRADAVSRQTPLFLPVGRRTRVRLEVHPSPAPGVHHLHLEFQSVAIPPLVWLEFQDDLRRAVPPP